ncbi:MAG: DUF4373 domain-containing protein [Lachnospiraceae bacterium]
MARPRKIGLDYFPFDTDFFEDNKIRILKARYKGDGVFMYIFLLTEIYRSDNGYYIQVDEDFEYILSDQLFMDINKVKQVLNFLLKRSLFNDKLFSSDKVLTSAGIQRRWQLAKKEAARKTPIEVGRYWLLSKEETEPFIKCTLFEVNHGETHNYSWKNSCNSAEKTIKESKGNNIDNTVFPPELERAFQMYLLVRESNHGEILTEQVQALRDDLMSLSTNLKEQLAIVKKATAGGYKSFFAVDGKKKKESKTEPKKNGFNNFEGRKYDQELMKKLIE